MALTTQVVLRRRSTVDGMAALHVLETVVGRSLQMHFVQQNVEISDDDLESSISKGVFPIGVGLGRTYRKREINGKKFGSETAIIIHELRSRDLLVHDKVLDDFARMMDRNNNDGYLRRQPYSVNWIVLQGYRLGHDPSEIDFPFTDEEVVRRGAHVVSVYLEACRRYAHVDLGTREQVMRLPAMELLPAGSTSHKGSRNHQGPMTVSRYIRDMFVLGLSEDEIFAKAEWFVRVHDRANERQIAAEKIATTKRFDTFALDGHREQGIWAESDDPYLLEALVKHSDLVVMRSSQGNVIAMSKTFDLSRAASALITREEGRWYYQSSPQILANGTEGVEGTPTGLYRVVIESTIGTFVRYRR